MKLQVVLADNHMLWSVWNSAKRENLIKTCLDPDSPKTGLFWMSRTVSFENLKITTKDKPGHIYLYTMHKYYLRLLIDEERKPYRENGKGISTPIIKVEFPETKFFAVTRHYNYDILQLKKLYNPTVISLESTVLPWGGQTPQNFTLFCDFN